MDEVCKHFGTLVQQLNTRDKLCKANMMFTGWGLKEFDAQGYGDWPPVAFCTCLYLGDELSPPHYCPLNFFLINTNTELTLSSLTLLLELIL